MDSFHPEYICLNKKNISFNYLLIKNGMVEMIPHRISEVMIILILVPGHPIQRPSSFFLLSVQSALIYFGRFCLSRYFGCPNQQNAF